MIVRLTHIDGKLPNLALMRLSAWHRARGDDIHFYRTVARGLFEPAYDRVYGSAIFAGSAPKAQTLREQFPGAIVGGTFDLQSNVTLETLLDIAEDSPVDYSIYPRFTGSLGFTQRGCRLKCGFCVVPKKEGKPRSAARIADIWRGEGHPKHLHLLDNDFFGQPREQWEARIAEIIDGGFRVCLNQGINVRLVDDTAAAALASIPYYDDGFKTRRLYTAWDSIGDEGVFMRGVDTLERHGVPARNLLVYMLVGYDKRETWERVFYRFEKMVARGMRPYPMVYGDRHRTVPMGGCNRRIAHRTLAEFQRWIIRKAYTFIPFEDYDVNAKGHGTTEKQLCLEAAECHPVTSTI